MKPTSDKQQLRPWIEIQSLFFISTVHSCVINLFHKIVTTCVIARALVQGVSTQSVCMKKPLIRHYHLEVQANPPKNAQKKRCYFSIYGKNGIIPWHFFFKFSLRPFEVVEFEWWSMLNFEAVTSKFGIHSWNFGSSPRKGKVDLCMTNGSKVLIYLTLLNFLLHYLQEYSKIWNIEKSNKSELWNRLSYRGLPYHFEVRS